MMFVTNILTFIYKLFLILIAEYNIISPSLHKRANAIAIVSGIPLAMVYH